jgi:exopolysaccharide biosynthesis protein
MDSNNYIMLTSINNLSFSKLSNIMADLKCKVAFNFDGGGSTSFFYKKKGGTSVSKVICQNNNIGGCRSIAEGIYFVGR